LRIIFCITEGGDVISLIRKYLSNGVIINEGDDKPSVYVVLKGYFSLLLSKTMFKWIR